MTEKKQEILVSYTIESLIEHIRSDYEERHEASLDSIAQDKYRLKVFDFLCGINAVEKEEGSIYPKIIREKIERLVEEDLFLSGYAFFLSSNPSYAYTWSYQQQKVEQYIDFIYKACNFIHHVVADVQYIQTHYEVQEDFSFVFNELIEVNFTKVSMVDKTKLAWSNFRSITDVRKGYYISLRHGATNIATKYVRYGKDHEKELKDLMAFVIRSLNATESLRNHIEECKSPETTK